MIASLGFLRTAVLECSETLLFLSPRSAHEWILKLRESLTLTHCLSRCALRCVCLCVCGGGAGEGEHVRLRADRRQPARLQPAQRGRECCSSTLHCTVLARTVHTVPSCPVLSCNVQRGREYSTALRSILSLASMPGHPRTVPYRTQPSPPRPLV